MYLYIELPTIHRVSTCPNGYAHSSALPNWTRWGWCNAREMAGLIQRFYGYQWTEYELLSRFGYKRGAVEKSSHSAGVLLMRQLPHSLQVFPYNEVALRTLRNQRLNFFVPAGWAKEVFWSLQNGGRRLAVIENQLVVCEESGACVCYF